MNQKSWMRDALRTQETNDKKDQTRADKWKSTGTAVAKQSWDLALAVGALVATGDASLVDNYKWIDSGVAAADPARMPIVHRVKAWATKKEGEKTKANGLLIILGQHIRSGEYNDAGQFVEGGDNSDAKSPLTIQYLAHRQIKTLAGGGISLAGTALSPVSHGVNTGSLARHLSSFVSTGIHMVKLKAIAHDYKKDREDVANWVKHIEAAKMAKLLLRGGKTAASVVPLGGEVVALGSEGLSLAVGSADAAWGLAKDHYKDAVLNGVAQMIHYTAMQEQLHFGGAGPASLIVKELLNRGPAMWMAGFASKYTTKAVHKAGHFVLEHLITDEAQERAHCRLERVSERMQKVGTKVLGEENAKVFAESRTDLGQAYDWRGIILEPAGWMVIGDKIAAT